MLQDQLPCRLNQKPHQGISFGTVGPDDHAAARFAVSKHPIEAAVRIIGVVDHADAEDDVELPSEIHGAEVGLDEVDVGVSCIPLPRNIDSIQIYGSDRPSDGRNKRRVLPPTTTALQHVLVTELLDLDRRDPVLEEESFVIPEHRPLLVPLGLLPVSRI